jgi:SAM-dependent methyltransferase
MRKQQKIWHDEHLTSKAIPALAEAEPSGGLVKLISMLKIRDFTGKRAVDIGCGKGRNSIYLAEQGFQVTGLEYIKPALEAAQKLAEARGQVPNIEFLQAEIDRPWEFPNDYFDLAVDSFSSIDIETLTGRQTYRDEMLRTLKPGGYAMVTVVSTDDEWEAELITSSPGSEPNSTIWPQNGKYQKDYDEAELRDFYKEFKVVALEKVTRRGRVKLGREYVATNFWLVLQKP